jgi:hypothetical protein
VSIPLIDLCLFFDLLIYYLVVTLSATPAADKFQHCFTSSSEPRSAWVSPACVLVAVWAWRLCGSQSKMLTCTCYDIKWNQGVWIFLS